MLGARSVSDLRFFQIMEMEFKSKHEIQFCFICIYTQSLELILYNVANNFQQDRKFVYTEPQES